MEKQFRQFWILSAGALIFYNLFAWQSGFSISDLSDKVMIGSFVLINLSMIMQLILMSSAYKAGKLACVFYHLPLIKIGFYGLTAMILMILLVLFVPDFPAWIGALGCLIIAFIEECFSFKAKKTAEYIESVDDKIADQTDFIRSMTVASKALIESAESEEMKKECKKIYETFRYSDPMSTSDLIDEEERIHDLFLTFISAVKNSQSEQAKLISNELQQKIQERNYKLLQRK